jgi:hypothetical protein
MCSRPLACPNCGQPVDATPVHCPLCGYQSKLWQEYFWLYAGGGAVVLAGIALGAIGVWVEGSSPGHWSETLRGWFPLGPWPGSHHWLAFVVEGIVLTIAGLGLTRRKRSAAVLLLGISAWEAAWTIRRLASGDAELGSSLPAALLLTVECVLLALGLRLVVALWRTPARDATALQRGAARRGEGRIPR